MGYVPQRLPDPEVLARMPPEVREWFYRDEAERLHAAERRSAADLAGSLALLALILAAVTLFCWATAS